MIAKAIVALVAAGKGFQIVQRLMKNGKVAEAEKVLNKLKGSDKKKAKIEFEAGRRRLDAPGTSTRDKTIDVKDQGASQIGSKPLKPSEKEQRLLDLKPKPKVTQKTTKNSLEVSDNITESRAAQQFRFNKSKATSLIKKKKD